jgi:hypothetical protein
MVWLGVLVLSAGAILGFAISGDIGGVEVSAVGVLTAIAGAVLLIIGIIRSSRGRPSRVANCQDRIYRTSKGKIIAMIAAVVYILSPIDIVPDVFLPVGIIDDATALSWLLFAIGQEVSRKRRRAL